MRTINVLYGCFFVIFLTACSNRTGPAPVTLLNSQVEKKHSGSESTSYVVKKGDTLFAVAWYTGNDYRDIAKYNSLSAPYDIYPGQKLRLTPPPTTALTRNTRPRKVQEKTGTTSKICDKRGVDPKPAPAYSEREINVNRQEVTSVKPLTKSVKNPSRRGFPDKVSKWAWPSEGNITLTFSNTESGNKGLDLSAQRGSPVQAAAEGKVVYAGNALRGYGNLIIIKHTNALLSAYAHNAKLLVEEQQWVAAGQQIATMGDSGTDSVKLHFEIRYRGKSLDPQRYLPKR